MKFRITDSAAAPLAVLAITARIFYGVVIDMTNLHNAAWLSVLAGGLLAFPLMFAAHRLREACPSSPVTTLSQRCAPLARALAGVLALLSLYDAAVMARAIANSASYVALNSLPMFYLMLPQLLLCLWCLSTNGDAIGTAAGIWKRVLLALMVVVILLQFSAYRPSWLTPILGPGAADLLDGAVRVAGWISMLTGLLLIAERDPHGKTRRFQPIKTLTMCVLLAAALLLLRSMMTPPLFKGEESSIYFQLDTLLSNGRAPLSLQLPLVILWFISLLFLLLFDAFLFAAMLQTALPRFGKRLCIAITVVATAILALSNLVSRSTSQMVAEWLFVAQGTIVALSMATLLMGDKKEAIHA